MKFPSVAFGGGHLRQLHHHDPGQPRGTTEDQIKYSCNYAMLLAEGPKPRAVPSPLYTATMRTAIVCAGASISVASAIRHVPRQHAAYRRDLAREGYGDERDPKMRDFLNRISPLNNSCRSAGRYSSYRA